MKRQGGETSTQRRRDAETQSRSPFIFSAPLRLCASALISSLLLSLLAACHSDPNGPQAVAERFVDQHYVMINVKAAQEFSTGLARHKLDTETKLTEGQAIDETTKKPTVRYRLLEKRDNPEQPAFIFEGTIYADGDDGFTRKWLITTRREGNEWKVSNFEEFE